MTDQQQQTEHLHQTLKARGIDLAKPSTFDPQTLLPPDLSHQQVATTRPSPPQWKPDQQTRYRLSPWGVAIPLILLSIGVNTLFAGAAFSFGAFLIEFGLILWLVIAMRRGLDQPYSSLLLPFGLISILAGIDWLADISFWAALLIIAAIWLIIRQFRRVKSS
jgi:hypothetical protein